MILLQQPEERNTVGKGIPGRKNSTHGSTEAYRHSWV